MMELLLAEEEKERRKSHISPYGKKKTRSKDLKNVKLEKANNHVCPR